MAYFKIYYSIEGRPNARKNGTLQFIKPGEKRNFDNGIQIIDGEDVTLDVFLI